MVLKRSLKKTQKTTTCLCRFSVIKSRSTQSREVEETSEQSTNLRLNLYGPNYNSWCGNWDDIVWYSGAKKDVFFINQIIWINNSWAENKG